MKKFINRIPKPLIRLIMLCLVVLIVTVIDWKNTHLLYTFFKLPGTWHIKFVFAVGIMKLTALSIQLLQTLTKEKNETD